MIRILVMQPMAIDPRNRININPKHVIHDRHCLDEPNAIVERAMRDPHVQYIGQVQTRHKPAANEINRPDCEPEPRSEVRGGEVHTRQRIRKNGEVAINVVDFHIALRCALFKQSSTSVSNDKLKNALGFLNGLCAERSRAVCRLRTAEWRADDLSHSPLATTPRAASARRSLLRPVPASRRRR